MSDDHFANLTYLIVFILFFLFVFVQLLTESGCLLGSGYLTACMAELVGKTGKVIGIDHIKELVELSKENIKRGNVELLKDNRVVLVTGDGRLGYPEGRF